LLSTRRAAARAPPPHPKLAGRHLFHETQCAPSMAPCHAWRGQAGAARRAWCQGLLLCCLGLVVSRELIQAVYFFNMPLSCSVRRTAGQEARAPRRGPTRPAAPQQGARRAGSTQQYPDLGHRDSAGHRPRAARRPARRRGPRPVQAAGRLALKQQGQAPGARGRRAARRAAARRPATCARGHGCGWVGKGRSLAVAHHCRAARRVAGGWQAGGRRQGGRLACSPGATPVPRRLESQRVL